MIPKNLPKSANDLQNIIEDAEQQKNKRVRVALDLTLEEADFLHSILSEISRHIETSIKSHAKQKRQALQRLRRMDDTQQKMFILALKALRMMRRRNMRIDSACIDVARKYYADFHALLQAVRKVESIRAKKIDAFRKLHIVRLHRSGMKYKDIMEQYSLSYYMLKKIIKTHDTKRINHESH